MTSDITLSPKDSVKLPFLRALLSGAIELSVDRGNGSPVDYRTAIHRDGCRVGVFAGCNFTEDAAADLLTVRPSALRETLTLTFTASAPGGSASAVRKSDKAEIGTFALPAGTSRLTFTPADGQTFRLAFSASDGQPSAEQQPPAAPENPRPRLSRPRPSRGTPPPPPPSASWDGGLTDGGFAAATQPAPPVHPTPPQTAATVAPTSEPVVQKIQNTQNTQNTNPPPNPVPQTDTVPATPAAPNPPPQTAGQRLEIIGEECAFDHAAFESGLHELCERLAADEEVLSYYKDHAITPTETLLTQARQSIEEAEEQIRRFIQARQDKTKLIENEIKSGTRR